MNEQTPSNNLITLPLRTRLAIAYVGFFAVALVALGFGLYLIVGQSLIGGVDSDLDRTAVLIQKNFEAVNRDVLPIRFRDDLILLVLRAPSVNEFSVTNIVVQIYEKREIVQGVINPRSNLTEPLGVDRALLVQALGKQSSRRSITVGDIQLRESIVPLKFRGEVVGVLQIARPLTETDRALQLLLYALMGGGLIVLLAAARGGAWLTRAALRPIDEITRTAQSIVGAEDLSRRVPVPPAQDELQRLTITINDLLGRLEGLFSAQRRFVADVSHELRTPLAAMRGNLEVLDRGAARDPALLAESLTDMRQEVNRLIRMVNDLLLLAQSESGVQLRREPVELDTLLLEVHRELRPLAGGVQLRIGEEDQAVVLGDRDRIKQALLNLGINALQHTPPGGVVTLGLGSGESGVRLSVSDTGSGIAAEDLPHIFERFYRADRARNHNSGGAGLGLPIVKWIADAHGGRVLVESVPGQGSTFTLLFPQEPAEAEPIVLTLPQKVMQ
ncbi:MAG TPA: ATP-binding protein [Roseiflexaceae bacterium]|nr:ATP-binding protein [Roseiflexaceae bacterium]